MTIPVLLADQITHIFAPQQMEVAIARTRAGRPREGPPPIRPTWCCSM